MSFEADAYVRAYTEVPGKKRKPPKGGIDAPSEFAMIFDCETTTDPAQTLRFGFFQVRKNDALIREGIFHDPETLTPTEMGTLKVYAGRHGLDICTLKEFRYKVFLRVGYEARAAIIGFNLPFDISRVARDWGEARGPAFRGGYSFELSPSYDDPHVRVKHLSSTTALIDFAKPAGQDTPRGMRRRGFKVVPHRGYFYDVKTLAAALHSRKFSLGSLCGFLGTETRKHEGVLHDGPLTDQYLDYARADVQATWECFEKLRDLYASYGLSTPLHRIQSEASIGKACEKDMGILPLLVCQPDTSRAVFGHIMASYFGGRAEVRIRRELRQVLMCDFKSMYPTVNTLMELWPFVKADGYTVEETTEATQAWLENLTLATLQDKATWRELATLVQLKPDGDILPLRTAYSPDRDTLTIGLNHVTSQKSLWYTLADVAASKLLTGKTQIIERAISFQPGPPQTGLKPINLLGNPAYRIDPERDDPFKRLVDMRDAALPDDPARQAFKIINNSTSYGTRVEVNRDDAPKPEPILIFGPDGEGQTSQSRALEQPGKSFNPLLGALITGAARLMLAAAERCVMDQGLAWVFCDTDSIAMAKPKDMAAQEFHKRCQRVVGWFEPLNPYAKAGSILKIEDINYRPDSRDYELLFAWGISAKRYSLLNIDKDGNPIIRKFSAHGLGHLMEPYSAHNPAKGVPDPITDVEKLGGKRWQYDFWYMILKAALSGDPNRVRRDYHPALSQPALSRYGATSPALLRWVKAWNAGKSYRQQIKPFGFLVAPMAKSATFNDSPCTIVEGPPRGRPSKAHAPKPVAPFERDPKIAASRAFDRETGEPVALDQLKTYAEALALYHLSPEDKFENAGPFDMGRTERRHVHVTGIRLIGKEANRVGEAGEPDPTSAVCVQY